MKLPGLKPVIAFLLICFASCTQTFPPVPNGTFYSNATIAPVASMSFTFQDSTYAFNVSGSIVFYPSYSLTSNYNSLAYASLSFDMDVYSGNGFPIVYYSGFLFSPNDSTIWTIADSSNIMHLSNIVVNNSQPDNPTFSGNFFAILKNTVTGDTASVMNGSFNTIPVEWAKIGNGRQDNVIKPSIYTYRYKLNHMTDKEMVYGIKAGNQDAYAGAVISYYKELYDLAYSQLKGDGKRAKAVTDKVFEDLRQGVFNGELVFSPDVECPLMPFLAKIIQERGRHQ